MPDAAEYDQGSDTLGNICRAVPDLRCPTWRRWAGPDLPLEAQLYRPNVNQGQVWSHGHGLPGQDTLTGHWELMGLITERPFQTFPEAFPEALIALLSSLVRLACSPSGPRNEIIQRLGQNTLARIPDHYIGGQRVANPRP